SVGCRQQRSAVGGDSYGVDAVRYRLDVLGVANRTELPHVDGIGRIYGGPQASPNGKFAVQTRGVTHSPISQRRGLPASNRRVGTGNRLHPHVSDRVRYEGRRPEVGGGIEGQRIWRREANGPDNPLQRIQDADTQLGKVHNLIRRSAIIALQK